MSDRGGYLTRHDSPTRLDRHPARLRPRHERRQRRMLIWDELQSIGWAIFAMSSGLVVLASGVLVLLAVIGKLAWR